MKLAAIALIFLFSTTGVKAAPLVEPVLRVTLGGIDHPHVALTLDACTGNADERILRALIDNNIKATVFVTARWLKRNPEAIRQFKAHADLFQVENHGARHVPAIDFPHHFFGLEAAGSLQAVKDEVVQGNAAVKEHFGFNAQWFRGAGAEYSASSITLITSLHFKIAGFSLAADGGASYSQSHTAATIATAQDGDVIIAHVNQPLRPAGDGVVVGILALQRQGFVFVTLDEGMRPDRREDW